MAGRREGGAPAPSIGEPPLLLTPLYKHQLVVREQRQTDVMTPPPRGGNPPGNPPDLGSLAPQPGSTGAGARYVAGYGRPWLAEAPEEPARTVLRPWGHSAFINSN